MLSWAPLIISPAMELQVAWSHTQHAQQALLPDHPHHITRHHHLPPYSITSHLHFTSSVTTSGLALQPVGGPPPPHHQTLSPAFTLHYKSSQFHSVSVSPRSCHNKWPGPIPAGNQYNQTPSPASIPTAPLYLHFTWHCTCCTAHGLAKPQQQIHTGTHTYHTSLSQSNPTPAPGQHHHHLTPPCWTLNTLKSKSL